MIHIPFDPEFDKQSNAARSSISISSPQLKERLPSKFAFVFGIIIALVTGIILANIILFKLIFNA